MEKTNKEITNLLKELKSERKRLPHYSMFGDDNWGSLDIQIETLENFKSGELDILDIERKQEEILNDNDGDFPENQIENAELAICDWLLGNIDEL